MCTYGRFTHDDELTSRKNTQRRTLQSGPGSGNKQFVPVGGPQQLRSWSKPSDTTAFWAGVRRGTALGHL